jgi:hypothetical protein
MRRAVVLLAGARTLIEYTTTTRERAVKSFQLHGRLY